MEDCIDQVMESKCPHAIDKYTPTYMSLHRSLLCVYTFKTKDVFWWKSRMFSFWWMDCVGFYFFILFLVCQIISEICDIDLLTIM